MPHYNITIVLTNGDIINTTSTSDAKVDEHSDFTTFTGEDERFVVRNEQIVSIHQTIIV